MENIGQFNPVSKEEGLEMVGSIQDLNPVFADSTTFASNAVLSCFLFFFFPGIVTNPDDDDYESVWLLISCC